ncbi:hypothetical protein [Lysobacter olei]
MKSRVPLWGNPQKSVEVEQGATKGATIGVNVYDADGNLWREPAPAAASTGYPVTVWDKLQSVPANVRAVAALATDGFVRKADATWTASPIVNADLAGADTDGLGEGATNLYYTAERAQDAVGAAIAAGTGDGASLAYDDAGNAINVTNTDKGSVARAAHEAAADPHPQYTTAAEAQAIADAKVQDTITDGVTDKAPSQNAVFDALADRMRLGSAYYKQTIDSTQWRLETVASPFDKAIRFDAGVGFNPANGAIFELCGINHSGAGRARMLAPAGADIIFAAGSHGFYCGNNQVGFRPAADSVSRLGNATYQWSQVHAKDYRVNDIQVVGARNTGWSAMTGTGSKASIAAAAAGTASAAYVQAELQAALNRIAALEARLKALDDALFTHGLIGT